MLSRPSIRPSLRLSQLSNHLQAQVSSSSASAPQIRSMAYSNTKFKLNTGAEIPAIGFGTWQDKDSQEDAVYEALKAGYRHIDTARMYVFSFQGQGSCFYHTDRSKATGQSRRAPQASRRVVSLEKTSSSPPSCGTTPITPTTSRRPVMPR